MLFWYFLVIWIAIISIYSIMIHGSDAIFQIFRLAMACSHFLIHNLKCNNWWLMPSYLFFWTNQLFFFIFNSWSFTLFKQSIQCISWNLFVLQVKWLGIFCTDQCIDYIFPILTICLNLQWLSIVSLLAINRANMGKIIVILFWSHISSAIEWNCFTLSNHNPNIRLAFWVLQCRKGGKVLHRYGLDGRYPTFPHAFWFTTLTQNQPPAIAGFEALDDICQNESVFWVLRHFHVNNIISS